MVKLREFEKTVVDQIAADMQKYGYKYTRFKEYKGSRSIFFRKNFQSQICGFVQIQLLTWIEPQAIQLCYFRNMGEIPRLANDYSDPGYLVWKGTSIHHLLWGLHKLEEERIEKHGLFPFVTHDELLQQLYKIVDLTIRYGIPWLEHDDK